MASTIKIKNSSTTGAVPTASDLVQGELAVNVTDTGLYTENASGTVVKLNAPSIDDKNTGATKHLTISTAGNLGLGVTPSAWGSAFKTLQIGSAAAFSGSTLTSQSLMLANAYSDVSGLKYINSAQASYYQQYQGIHSWYNAASGTAGNAITFTQAMTLDASGNLGIGTSSPATRLHVAGGSGTEVRVVSSASLADGTGSSIVRFGGSNSATSGYIGYGGTSNDYYAWNALSGNMIFGTANLERARIDSSGTFSVNGGFQAANNGVTTVKRTDVTSGSGADGLVYRDGSNDVCGSVQINATANTVTYVNSSDSRLKTNPRDFDGTALILQMQPKKYERFSNMGVDEIGMYAQELHPILPEAVGVGGDDPQERPWGIDYGRITPVLIKAIQEQQAMIASQSELITQLQADVAALKGQA